MARKITTEIFIKESEERFGKGIFDYSKTIYAGADKKLCIICPIHGEFWVTPSNFKRYKKGCPKCGDQGHALGLEEFIKRSKEKFGNKFDYSKVIYKSRKTPITLICPIHGEFEIIPEKHLNSPTGCQQCSKEKDKKKLVDGKDRKQMREYRIWKAMKNRTTNPNSLDSARYIERGISCCKEWLDSFEQFYSDMGPCPEGYSIDRINNDGNYCPENCRWASPQTQATNRGEFNKIFTYNGESHVLKEWARIFHINYGTIYNRIFRDGLAFKDAIKEDPYDKLFNFKGEKKKLKEWCEIYNIKYSTVINRIHKHKWTLEEALLTPYKHKKIQI